MEDLKKLRMELLYIWIEDFKNIKNEGINFSGQFRFDFNSKTAELSINHKKEKDSLPDNFWGDQITNITTIVGENGAGKTTILHFLNSFLGNYYCKGIIAFRVKEKGKDDTIQIFKHHKLAVKLDNKTKLASLPFEQFSIVEQTDKVDLLRKINVIYFSNAIGVRAFWGNPNQLDISTNFILENLNQNQGVIRKLSLMDSFKLGELKKQVAFLDEYAEDFEIHFGNRLIKVGGFYKSMADGGIQKVLGDLHLNKEFMKIIQDTFNPENNTTWHRVTDPLFFKVYLGLMIIVYSENDIGFHLNQEKLTDILIKIEKRLIDLKLENESNLFSFILKLSPSDYETMINIHEQYMFIDPFSFQFEIARKQFNKFLELYEKTLKGTDYLGFSWNLSSGENAYLNIFSRIHNLANSEKLKKEYPIWLLVDEGELYLHPQWQKSFTKNMIYFMSKIFKGNEFQMIFTSHSPLILSDFPKESIVFIERNEDGTCKVSNLKEHDSTFASNIYELYKDSFFLKGSFFGEYAEDEINKIISYLSKTQSSEVAKPEKDRMKFIIQSIGDDVFKNKLIEVWNEKNKNDLILHDKN